MRPTPDRGCAVIAPGTGRPAHQQPRAANVAIIRTLAADVPVARTVEAATCVLAMLALPPPSFAVIASDTTPDPARPPLPPGPWLVVGLARSGAAALAVLRARGEDARGWDAKQGGDGLAQLEHARVVVKSPGVPREAAVIAAALDRGRPVIGEVELAWRLLPNELIAITGTNGKTTTTELVGHVHRVAGLPVAVAGNVGTPLSALVGTVAPEATIVCEVSSFQAEDTVEFAPEAAVLLNLTPDHLDRHTTLEAYRAAKLRVFANQGNDDVAVAPVGLGIEDLGGCARRVCFGADPGAELSERAGVLWWAEEPLLGVEEIRLRGVHNRHNAMAAAAVCLARGVEADAVREALRTFEGVEHRLEEVGLRDGVLYVNDSKATNVDSTLVALASFESPVHLILGGQGKGQDFTPLREPVRERCAGVYLIGEDAATIAAVVGGRRCGDLEHAVAAARASARRGEVVLLSPACASYDQFVDFEARGRAFKELVG
jgi:UDP-N-acetylmuramoylalanine--D-glutamate ligase